MFSLRFDFESRFSYTHKVRTLPVLETRASTLLAAPPVAESFEPPRVLRDALGRSYSYLRLSITDRCDLRCLYCMPEAGEAEHGLRKELLDFDEIERLVGLLGQHGVRRVRLTGGEPLIRRDISILVERLAALEGIDEVVMTTNATRLESFASALAAAGVKGVNVSLDSLRPARFAELTRGGNMQDVLRGLGAAQDAGLEVKLNTVVLGGVNDDELEEIVRFAWERSITPRFIELMPLGRDVEIARVVPSHEIEARLDALLVERLPNEEHRGPAYYRTAADGSGKRVGFISAVTNNFCDTCNRLRITAKGELRACLASRSALSFRDMMRAGASDKELLWALMHALSIKANGHYFNDPDVTEHARVGMSLIGG